MSAGPDRGLLPSSYKKLAALRHRVAGAADRVSLIKVLDRMFEEIASDRPRLPEGLPRRPRHHVRFGQDWMLVPHLAAQPAQLLERQRTTDRAGQGAHNLPILARLSRRE